jgi:hypothetical protein
MDIKEKYNIDMFKSLWFLIIGVSLAILSSNSEGWVMWVNAILAVSCLSYSAIKYHYIVDCS